MLPYCWYAFFVLKCDTICFMITRFVHILMLLNSLICLLLGFSWTDKCQVICFWIDMTICMYIAWCKLHDIKELINPWFVHWIVGMAYVIGTSNLKPWLVTFYVEPVTRVVHNSHCFNSIQFISKHLNSIQVFFI